MDIVLEDSTKREDERGFLVDFIKGTEVEAEDRMLGQVYYVTFSRVGVIRGNHYHKERREWFVPVKGRLEVYFKDLATGEEVVMTIDGDSSNYQRIGIGKNIAHAFVSLTEDAAMINYASKPYIHEAPDTYEYILVNR